MKAILLALAVLATGASAATKSPEGRFIDVAITDAVQNVANMIIERGLDPIEREGFAFSYRLPVTDLLKIDALLENLLVKGLSNISINNIDFSIIFLRLRYDIGLPEIAGSLDTAEASVVLGSAVFDGSVSGTLVARDLRVSGEIRLGIGFSGLYLRDLQAVFTLSGIDSNVTLKLFGFDLSDQVNTLFGVIIPFFFEENKNAINELLEYLLRLIYDSTQGY